MDIVGNDSWIGGRLYVQNLVKCMVRLPESMRPDILLIGNLSNDALAQEVLALDYVCLGRQGFWADRKDWDRRWAMRLRRAREKVTGRDPWFADVDVIYPVLSPASLGGKELYWIPDFQHLHLPKYFSSEECRVRSERFATIAHKEAIVVLSSCMARDDFFKFFPTSRAKPIILRLCSFIDVAPTSNDLRIRHNFPAKFLYLPSQFWAHKNHEQVFRALGILKARGLNIPTVCTGFLGDHRNDRHMDTMKELLRAQRLTDTVHLLGLLPRTDQIQLYRYAACVIQPSRFEGWSMVVEDAKALGRPILLSDFPVHREQFPQGTFFALDDVEGLASLLAETWQQVTPGPNVDAEVRAGQMAVERQQQCAREFVEIASATHRFASGF
jgi:glycosyltransferase involved in cell wall biosynthesis